MASPRIVVVESAPFAENSYVVWAEGQTRAIVIDPGFEPDKILDVLKRNRLTLDAILCTHGHVDHIAGNAALKAAYPLSPILIGQGDAAMLTDSMLNRSGMYGFDLRSPPADRTLVHGEVVSIAGLDFEVREIPGHSPGHIVYVGLDARPVVVIGGDVLFAGSVGRTDFPGGSFDQLRSGIEAHLWTLPDDAIVYPGHGPTTTIGHEKQTNPYVGQSARSG